MGSAEDGSVEGALTVAIACSPRAGVALELSLRLPASATVGDAVRSSGLLEQFPELGSKTISVGVWGRSCGAETLLHDGDRVEIYRPLTLDPNEARRLRAKRLRERNRR